MAVIPHRGFDCQFQWTPPFLSKLVRAYAGRLRVKHVLTCMVDRACVESFPLCCSQREVLTRTILCVGVHSCVCHVLRLLLSQGH